MRDGGIDMGLFDWLPGYRTPNIFDAIEFIDSVTSDPETEGKKDGYERAAKEYEPIYQDLKHEYDSAIAEIECQKKNYDIESSVQIGYLSKLEEKRDSLQERVNAKAQQTASAYGVSVSTLMSSFSSAGVVQGTSWDLMRFITDSRMRRRKEAEKVGYSEAKQLYEKKLKSLRDKLEQEKENASRQLKDYANLISKILAEIEDNQMKIADLEIALQEN